MHYAFARPCSVPWWIDSPLHEEATDEERKSHAAGFRYDAWVFGKAMANNFGEEVTGCIYLHVLVCHVWRWLEDGKGLLRYGSYDLERTNRMLKLNKHGYSVRDKLDSKEPIQKDLTQVMQMVQRHNITVSEYTRAHAPPAALQRCSHCHQTGHNKRTCDNH